MKKAQKHIAMLIILTILLSIAGISHATGDVTMQLTSNSKLEEGKTVEVSLAITSINAGEGIDTVTAQLNYDKEVFEPVTGKKSLEGQGDWSCVAYNEDDGVFILSSDNKVNTNSEVMKVELKVKGNITVDETEVSIQSKYQSQRNHQHQKSQIPIQKYQEPTQKNQHQVQTHKSQQQKLQKQIHKSQQVMEVYKQIQIKHNL